ncbi:MAG: hypothetical protein CMJ81_04715 [Planctomycetaceae bacterium]|nr:hypothetical protein [Planctomycetaceae bacterium]MBP63686.1 hypothetical protein [Planctomycetaceae bacterium]
MTSAEKISRLFNQATLSSLSWPLRRTFQNRQILVNRKITHLANAYFSRFSPVSEIDLGRPGDSGHFIGADKIRLFGGLDGRVVWISPGDTFFSLRRYP